MSANASETLRSTGKQPEPAAAKRRVGRPRDPKSGEAILAVTLRLLGERGYGGLTVDDIVAEARVSKSTIYRRWPTKEELVVAAFDMLPELKVHSRGNVIAEFLDLARQYVRALHRTPLASVLPGLISEATRNPALARQLQVTFDKRTQPCRTIVVRAIQRGDLPRNLDADIGTELFMAPLIQRSFFAIDLMDTAPFRQMFEIILAGIWQTHGRAGRASKRPTASQRAATLTRG